ncbi:hypothetical protein KR018_010561 [Drosophila ironensis]|nr:hypothetical protein KR018_010561 [Drosophila ironensis]
MTFNLRKLAGWSGTLILVCCLCFLYFLKTQPEEKEPADYEKDEIRLYDTNEYSINTSGCRIKLLKPFSPTAMSYMEPFGPIVCRRTQLMVAKTIEGRNYVVLTKPESGFFSNFRVTPWRHFFCMYREFIRLNEFNNKYISRKILHLSKRPGKIEVGTGQQNLIVRCWVDFGQLIFHDVLFFLPQPPPEPPPQPNANSVAPQTQLSAMIMGLDSLSHMHFLRLMHPVADYIEGLSHTEFWGYNRVAHNTYPNLMPLLSGLSVDEIENSCYDVNFDKCQFLWSDYKAAGFLTSFVEDTDAYGLFTFEKNGFAKPPTDFYSRPVFVEMQDHTFYRTDYGHRCSGHRLYEAVFYEFIYKLMPHMRQHPFFSFFWRMQGLHDDFNFAKLVNTDYLNILQELKTQGIMERTLILFMSDHGIRGSNFGSTYVGRLEMSQPLLIAIYPEWMKKRFPLAMSNFQQNSRRLVTTFDLHETLKDVLDLDRLSDANVNNRTQHLETNSRGISLFLPVPESRHCSQAGILHHYCLCEELTEISTEASSVKEAAALAVDAINELIKPFPQCQRLHLMEIREAYGFRKDSVYRILVRLRTTPGDGCFDATVVETTQLSGKRTKELSGPVTRMNRYAEQAFCIHDFRVEMYCYCL